MVIEAEGLLPGAREGVEGEEEATWAHEDVVGSEAAEGTLFSTAQE